MLRATLQVKRGGSGGCLYRISVERGCAPPAPPCTPPPPPPPHPALVIVEHAGNHYDFPLCFTPHSESKDLQQLVYMVPPPPPHPVLVIMEQLGNHYDFPLCFTSHSESKDLQQLVYMVPAAVVGSLLGALGMVCILWCFWMSRRSRKFPGTFSKHGVGGADGKNCESTDHTYEDMVC